MQAASFPFAHDPGPPDPDLRAQVGAICRDAAGAVLLVTSLTSRRWVIPKGWPIPGLADPAAALQEAWEEAGVRGDVDPTPIGRYDYDKARRSGAMLRCRVTVYPVAVRSLAPHWPEADRRQRRWAAPAEAAALVAEPGLRALLLSLRS